MKINYQFCGDVSKITVISTVFELHRHIRVVDTALICTPGVSATRSGFFIMKTVISGSTKEMLRAYRTIQREVSK